MHFVLCYPKFGPADREAVEAFRRVHEPARAKLVPAHVTLVFGVTSVSGQTVAALAKSVADAHSPFDFAFDGLEVEAHEKGDHNLMLKVGEGRSRFIAMYDAFYGGPLAAERRADIEFSPHLTIATDGNLEKVIAIAPNAKPLAAIKGRAEFLEVATLDGDRLHPIVTVALGGGD